MKYQDLEYWDEKYEMPLDMLPWEIREAPADLRACVEANKCDGGKALDAGCGTGNFSMYLARNGFIVTGVDYSEKALEIARERNAKAKLPITYLRADLTELTEVLPAHEYDLILDYKVSHHFSDELIQEFARQCEKLLKTGGRLMVVCYSDKSDESARKVTHEKLDINLYYRSLDEMRDIFKAYKEVSYQEVMLGKKLNFVGHCFVFAKE